MSKQYELFLAELSDIIGDTNNNYRYFFTNDGYLITADRAFDINNKTFLAIFNIEYKHLDNYEISFYTHTYSQYQDYLQVKWFILWSNGGEKIFVRSINKIFIEYDNPNEVLKAIESSEEILYKKQLSLPFDAKSYIRQINVLINELIRGPLYDLNNKRVIECFFEQLKPNDIEIVEDVLYLKEQKETEFFLSLLTQIKDNTILWRYTSCHSLFLMLRNSSQNLLSINCMNDKSELDYADKYVNSCIINNEKPYISTNVQEANQVYILACCEESKCDDLLMWRLYGQDAQGVSIGYALNRATIDFENFYIAKVSYADNELTHNELCLIGNIIEYNYQGRSLRFKKWAIWKHFFKPHAFRYENEVRLIYYDKEGNKSSHTEWIEDSKNGILSPMKIFLLNKDFPLMLKRIIIGPKVQESDINRLQYKAMYDASTIFNNNDLEITESSISIYR